MNLFSILQNLSPKNYFSLISILSTQILFFALLICFILFLTPLLTISMRSIIHLFSILQELLRCKVESQKTLFFLQSPQKRYLFPFRPFMILFWKEVPLFPGGIGRLSTFIKKKCIYFHVFKS